MFEVLNTKLFIPRIRQNLVFRPRLVERLNSGLYRKLTLIAAPAGFGKTTLLSEWIRQSPRCVTWLSLDLGDNDPTKFWTYFIVSLQQLRRDLGKDALNLLQSPQPVPITSVLTSIINDISAFQDDFAMVLDDYHVIQYQPIHEGMVYLLDHLPHNVHLVISTRVDPPLPLGRLRIRENLNEFRANDLRFSVDEASAFLKPVLGLELSAQDVSALDTRTEGWIAGLQIAALSMKGREDIQGFIEAFSGSHRHILGYLAEEVLDHQPKELLNFLLTTSVLDMMCGPLCDEITESSGGHAILEKLDKENLFISPLDETGYWYRYHRLFAEVLQSRLMQTNPDQVQGIHRRAGAWFLRQGMIDEAIRHELAASNYDQAGRLIVQVAGKMLRKGMAASLAHWLDAVPGEIVYVEPRLCLARGWAALLGPNFSFEIADHWANVAHQLVFSSEISEPEVIGEVYALKALIAADRVDLAGSREFAHRALETLPAGNPWLDVTTFCLGSALFAGGDFFAAVPVLSDALQLSQADGALYIQLIAGSFLGDIQMYQGRLTDATEMYRKVLGWAGNNVPHKGALLAHAGLANVLCEQNELDAALASAQTGVEQIELVGGPGVALWLYRILARIQQAKGNWAASLDAIDQAYKSGEEADSAFVMAQSAAFRARLLLAQGQLEPAALWAENSGLTLEGLQVSPIGLRDSEYRAYALVLSAQGKYSDALFLLERLFESSKSENRTGSIIENLALLSLVLHSQGNLTRAFECLEKALILAEPEGYIRVFVDEGDAMWLLLTDYLQDLKQKITGGMTDKAHRLLVYTDRLLAAFHRDSPADRVEPLSERELSILRLIATGRSNQEIAEILVIAVSTVKSHINSLYGKLGTHRRTQAISIARDLGILSQ